MRGDYMNLSPELTNQIRKPNQWNTYISPLANLVHAMIIQALSDCNGYKDEQSHRYKDGVEAREFLEEYGDTFILYLSGAKKSGITTTANEGRKYRRLNNSGAYKYKKL